MLVFYVKENLNENITFHPIVQNIKEKKEETKYFEKY